MNVENRCEKFKLKVDTKSLIIIKKNYKIFKLNILIVNNLAVQISFIILLKYKKVADCAHGMVWI